MIESMEIGGVATYGPAPQALVRLSKLNFFYGSNGSGKTTITRVIADEALHPTCRVAWRGGAKLEALVYNRDYVQRNFNPSALLKGIFTLGVENVDAAESIAAAKSALDGFDRSLETLKGTLSGVDGAGGKKGELATLEDNLKQACWRQKQKHDGAFATAFEGVRNSQDRFKARLLQERGANVSGLVPLADMAEKALIVFGDAPTAEALIQAIDFTPLIAHEAHRVLARRVMGKDDVDIAAMIVKLGNSDWVKQGRAYLETNDSTCPFCQRRTTEEFDRSLNEYFDEAFLESSREIDALCSAHASDGERLSLRLAALVAAPPRFLDLAALRVEKELFEARFAINVQRLGSKKREPSQIVDMEGIAEVAVAIVALVDAANTRTAAHNATVSNLAAEKRALAGQVWRHLLDAELKADLADYDSRESILNKAIAGIETGMVKALADKAAKSAELRALEKVATSVQPTVDSINGVLRSFGFRGFSLACAADGVHYALRRADGSEAKETLSEGEKSFVTFLYFYHSLKGSDTASGTTANRVVVFDDPVSSLDSDILFIVGSLIKALIHEVRADATHIKQIFVLTHNVYFHKEVTFDKDRRNNKARSDETFWVVRKANPHSLIESHESNPVRTSYELLWSEIRKPDRSNLTIQNTLRRILESYFKILGRIDNDDIFAKFEGLDKIACRSLFSWINDGSHFAHEDLFVAVEASTVDRYLRVFRAVFERSDHGGHYKMMMGDSFVEKPAESEPQGAIAA